MKKIIFLFCIYVFLSCFCSCSFSSEKMSIENKENTNIIQSENNSDVDYLSNTEIIQEEWVKLNDEELIYTTSATYESYFLLTEKITFDAQLYKTRENSTNVLLELLQNLEVRKVDNTIAHADYYLLLYDKNNAEICLIEVWDKYICINHNEIYEVSSDDFFQNIKEIISECEELNKIPVEEILLTCVKNCLYGEFNEEDIILYNEQPAILVESNFECLDSEEKYYYEKYIYCDAIYFDKDYQTTYMFSQSTIYYNTDGSIKDTHYTRIAYYDYLTGERKIFMY